MLKSLSSRFSSSDPPARRGKRPNPLGRTPLADDYDDDDPERHQNLQSYESDTESNVDGDGDDNWDAESVYTTLTINTIMTADNENVKPLAEPEGAATEANQIFVSGNAGAPLSTIKKGTNDVTKTSVYLKGVTITKDIALRLLELVRGDNRSWESIAVDILRQKKVRWNSIVFDECASSAMTTLNASASSLPPTSIGSGGDMSSVRLDDDDDMLDNSHNDVMSNGDLLKQVLSNSNVTNEGGNYLDLILSNIINIDNCSFVHLSNMKTFSPSTSFALQSLLFSKNINKLQLDFITNLDRNITTLSSCLRENKSITCFIVSRCGLNDDQLGILLSNLPKKIQELRLFGNKCRMKGLAALAQAIKRPSKDQKKKNRLIPGKTTLDANSPYRPLKVLDLSYQHVQVNQGDIFDLKKFSDALCENKTLKVLDLDNDSLDDTQLSYVVKALCKNRTLQELMLNHNAITGTGVAVLASKFGEMKGLKKISMYSNLFDTSANPGKKK